MELLLNLAWLLLALPGYWLWREAGVQQGKHFSSLKCFSALACVLVLLFPVVSATDDLHAIRAEMEDSAFGKQTIAQSGSEKNSARINRTQNHPATLVSALWFAPLEIRLLELPVIHAAHLFEPWVLIGGRSPPFPPAGSFQKSHS